MRFTPIHCTECPLHEGPRNPGLPTRRADLPRPQPSTDVALLVVGEAPGFQEDLQFTSWVGRSGQLLHRCLSQANLHEVADIYLANACRCRPPQNRTPTVGQIKKCRPHLHADIRTLLGCYARVYILCAGASAARSVLNLSLSKAFSRQGLPQKLAEDLPPLPVFCTYHPAFLLRQPSQITSVRDHLLLLGSSITEPTTPAATGEQVEVQRWPMPPGEIADGLLSVDIETYGALAQYEQTAFHPVKSHVVDRIPYPRMIQTVALGWRDPQGTEHSAIFPWTPEHRQPLYAWMRAARQRGWTLVGQNLIFDLMYLRACDAFLRKLLGSYSLRLEDTILWNFLHSELRPERGLKEVARLFTLAQYRQNNLSAASKMDEDLWRYNCLDTVVTLRARTLFREAIARDYGPASPKLSELCHRHASDLLWTCLGLSEAGIPYDVAKLQALDSHYRLRALRAVDQVGKLHGLAIRGPGSKKDTQRILDAAVDFLTRASRLQPSELQLTPKTREVSTADDNLNLLIDRLHRRTERSLWAPLRWVQIYRKYWKLHSTYTHPLLCNPLRGIVTRTRLGTRTVGLCYPTWYPCPSRHDDDTATKEGGTVQGRITCKHPAKQTEPRPIRRCRTSRFRNGAVIHTDFSQIELRVAAFLSGDPVMLDEYARGIDRHLQTGDLIYSVVTRQPEGTLRAMGRGPRLVEDYRQNGKTTNFLITFEGQAPKLRLTLLKDNGADISLADCQMIIDRHDRRYSRLRQWQKQDLLEEAVRTGYVVLPTGWSRMYLGGRTAVERERATIFNQPVQTIAAQLAQSAQAAIARELEALGLRSRIDTNVYDSIDIDCPPCEVDLVRRVLEKVMPNPPLLQELEALYNRRVPIGFDTSITTYGDSR